MRQLKSIFRIAGLTVLAMALVGLMPAVAAAAERKGVVEGGGWVRGVGRG